MAMKKDPDHAYDINRLNMWFALSSIILFVFFVWMMWEDFHKDWKHYQARFRKLDRVRTQLAAQEEESKLSENPEYQKLLQERAAAEAELKQQQADYKKALAEQSAMQGVWYKADQEFRFKKAEYEAKRYEAEEAKAANKKNAQEEAKALKETHDEMERLSAELDKVNASKAEIDARVAAYTAKLDELEKNNAVIRTKVDRLLRKEQNIAKSFANLFRNLPLVDFMNPSLKIQQVVINNQLEDLNFIKVPRVDRCMTCHVGIDQEGFTKDLEVPGYGLIEQPFVSHPNLELYASSTSKHPMETFGCTGCHLGRGRATDFTSVVHVPDNEKQKEEWEKKYHWHKLHHWDTPMYSKSMVEASCIKCHTGEAMIPEGKKINVARMLFIENGCHGCHQTKGFENLPKVGPDLRRISSKVTKEWTFQWIKDPKGFRPTTRMPRFFGNSNNSSPEDVGRSDVEIQAMVEYLFSKSETISYPDVPLNGDAKHGETLVHELGCVGCHLTQGESPSGIDSRRRFGPALDKLGSKTTASWLYHWIKEPRHYSPLTRMPNMRLSEQEAVDITAYLMSLHDTAWERKPRPNLDEKYLKEEILHYMKRQYGLQAEAEYNKLTPEQRWNFLGEKTVQRYGCSGCHLIQGLENAKGIGTSLSEEGSKLLSKFDFGFVDIQHDIPSWITQKLHDPRSFDKDRVKRWDEKLQMPNFGFTDEEVSHLTMLIMGLTKEQVPAEAQRVLTAQEQIAEKGRWLVLTKNCVACHNIDGWGGEIATVIKERGLAPPALIREGEKVQSDWLFKFLKGPGHIRPWLRVRMPNFRLTDEEANTLVQYFMASSDVGPFHAPPEPQYLTEGKEIFTLYRCTQCHVVAGQVPPDRAPQELAPDLSMASSRLRADWIPKWLEDPQKLMPGTNMPDFFPEGAVPTILEGDPQKQKIALRNYLYSIGIGPLSSFEEVPWQGPQPAASQ